MNTKANKQALFRCIDLFNKCTLKRLCRDGAGMAGDGGIYDRELYGWKDCKIKNRFIFYA